MFNRDYEINEKQVAEYLENAIEKVKTTEDVDTLSDHKDASFGESYGVLMKENRLLARAIFVVDSNNQVTYVEYVPEVTDHPNYEAAIEAAKNAK